MYTFLSYPLICLQCNVVNLHAFRRSVYALVWTLSVYSISLFYNVPKRNYSSPNETIPYYYIIKQNLIVTYLKFLLIIPRMAYALFILSCICSLKVTFSFIIYRDLYNFPYGLKTYCLEKCCTCNFCQHVYQKILYCISKCWVLITTVRSSDVKDQLLSVVSNFFFIYLPIIRTSSMSK